MLSYVKVINEINKIIAFCMVKGVQPQELVTSIFESEYQNIETYKRNEYVHVVLTFSDVHDDGVSCIKMKYIYNKNKQLLSVSQKIDSSRYKVQWDRNEKLEEMLNKLATQLPKDSQVINRVRDAIPDDYKTVFCTHLKIAC